MLVVKNAKISTGKKDETRDVTIVIDAEKISSVEEPSFKIPKKAEVIDAKGSLVLPGAIDPHVHFNTPGYENHEDFAHGTQAAAAGGVTTVIDMPDTSVPPVTNKLSLDLKLDAIKDQAYVDYALWGGVSANSMREEWWHDSMSELHEAGVVGFKAYLISSMDTFRELSLIELGQVMQYARSIDALVGLHAEVRDIVVTRTEELKKQNKNSLTDYYFSRSDPIEKQGVAIGIHLVVQTQSKLHIVHLSSSAAADIIRRSKMMEVDVTAETCPHYLQFTYKDFEKLGSLIKTAPVVKTEKDREGLWEALEDGTVDFIATDHAPSSKGEKNTGSCWTDYNGIPGVELMLPYLFSFGYMKQRLTLARLIETTSTAAAKRFGLYPRKGALSQGSDADLVIIDSANIWKPAASKLHSKAKWTPFEDLTFTGQVKKTILRGRVVYDLENGIVGKPDYGQWIKRESTPL